MSPPYNKISIMKYFLIFLFYSAIPSVLQIIFEFSSYTQGFAVNVFLILIVVLISRSFSKYLKLILCKMKLEIYICFGLLMLLHLFIIVFREYIGNSVDYLKFLVGLTMLVGLLLQSVFIAFIIN